MHQSNLIPNLGPFSAQGSVPASTSSFTNFSLDQATSSHHQQSQHQSNPSFYLQQYQQPHTSMAKHKRKSSTGDGAEASKKAKTGAGSDRPMAGGSSGQQMGKVDPTFGQRSAIPGLDDDYSYEEPGSGEENLDYGSCASGSEGMSEEDKVGREAMQYLRAVRLEATSIPTLLVAPRQTDDRSALYDDGIGDSRGYYHDGAYVAAPPSQEFDDAIEDGDGQDKKLPQQAYFDSILRRYNKLKEQLATAPPRSAVERLHKDQAIHMGNTDKEWKTWRYRLRSVDSASAQLACMNKGTVLRLLRLVTKDIGAAGVTKKLIGKRMSRWVWGLLARLPDRGELSSEEIGTVRELGKRAVWVGVRVKGVHDLSVLETAQQTEDDVEDEDELEVDDIEEFITGSEEDVNGPSVDANEDVENHEIDPTEDLEAVRARLLARLPTIDQKPVAPEQIPHTAIASEAITETQAEEEAEEDLLSNTKATVDMIVTIVGEVYGQRDLLEFREAW